MVLGRAVVRELVDYAPWPGACGVGDCARLLLTLRGPGDTSWAGIDRIQPARPPWPWRHCRPRIKKKSFSAPSTCHIDLFGPVANRTVLKRLHVASMSNLVCLSPSKRPPARAIVALWLANRCNLRIARLFIRPRLHGGSARASSAVYAAAARLTARAARSAARSGAVAALARVASHSS